MPETILKPEAHVLSTLEKDGSRRWLNPKLSKGFFLNRRRLVAYALIVIFTLIPFLKVGGKPFILLDIPAREFTIFGFTFLPTDTVLLAMVIVGLLLSIVLMTALFGRVWCGWACPQTVYMEFLYRPIERFFDGTSGRGGVNKKGVPAWRTIAKYIAYLVISIYLANTFLAYFVGVETLSQWVTQSPIQHPIPFLVMAAVTVGMMFDFCYFREQLCIIACPYGRFQSVMLDQSSLIVSYDQRRGDPRGKAKKKPDSSLPVLGDCVDCGNCVTTCPTGIDIRDGLQMECINCTQCIDACNTVMEKIGREPNLIRYSSELNDQGKRAGFLRARTVIYPLLLLAIAISFIVVFTAKKNFDADIFRGPGNPHTMTDDGMVRNILNLQVTNRLDDAMTFETEILVPEGAIINHRDESLSLEPRETRTFHFSVVAAPEKFNLGRSNLKLRITNDAGQQRTIHFKLIGPY